MADVALVEPASPGPAGRHRAVAFGVERYECPTCESVVPLTHVTSRVQRHPTMATEQRVVSIDCEACGSVHDATLMLLNGQWSAETCQRRTA